MRPTVYPILLTFSSLGFVSIANGQDGHCSMTCRDQPGSTEGGGLLHLQQLSSAGEKILEQLAHDKAGPNSAGQVYSIFGGNSTASLRSDSISEVPESRSFTGRRNFLRICTNSCSITQTSNEKSTPQHEDGLNLSPSSRPGNRISRGEPKARGKSDADSTKKFATQSAKKSTVAKRGHDKSSRINHRKM